MNHVDPNDFSNDEDIMDVLAQHFPPPPTPRNSDELPNVKDGETVPVTNDAPTASEVWELVASSEPPKYTNGSKGDWKEPLRSELRLFDDNYDENECAEECVKLIKKSKRAFRHGKVLKELREDTETGEKELVEIDAAAFPSRMSELAVTVRYYLFKGQWYSHQKRMSKYKAEILLKTLALLTKVLPVALLVPCPMLIEDEAGTLRMLGPGYHHRRGGIIVTKNKTAHSGIPLETAKKELCHLADDTLFASAHDGWRDFASLLTPALAMGGWIKGPVPMDLSVAEEFESGKGYRQQVIGAVYNMKLFTVGTTEGGVGSLDESVATAMSKGKFLIQIDNVVGDFKSPFMAALMTAEDISVRIPFSIATGVNPRRHYFFVTSNGANLTPDIASRCNVVRLLKRPSTYAWKAFPEGDLLDHVRAQQEHYLGCVFRIIKAWHEEGKPRSKNQGHRFREWFQIIDWILEHICGAKGVFEDHREAQEQQTGAAASFLTSIAEAFHPQPPDSNVAHSASDILAVAIENQIKVLGASPDATPETMERQIGNILGSFFPRGFSEAEATVGAYKIRRIIRYCQRPHRLRHVSGEGLHLCTKCKPVRTGSSNQQLAQSFHSLTTISYFAK